MMEMDEKGEIDVRDYRRCTANIANYNLLKELAKEHRKKPTVAERMAWNLFRQAFPDIKFRRQHVIGDYIVDFVCFQHNLVIEIDGDYHSDEDQRIKDQQRTEDLKLYKLNVIRFSNEEIIQSPNSVIDKIKAFMNNNQ